jgi:hypothetical protein
VQKPKKQKSLAANLDLDEQLEKISSSSGEEMASKKKKVKITIKQSKKINLLEKQNS